jgi:hypothetical protein
MVVLRISVSMLRSSVGISVKVPRRLVCSTTVPTTLVTTLTTMSTSEMMEGRGTMDVRKSRAVFGEVTTTVVTTVLGVEVTVMIDVSEDSGADAVDVTMTVEVESAPIHDVLKTVVFEVCETVSVTELKLSFGVLVTVSTLSRVVFFDTVLRAVTVALVPLTVMTALEVTKWVPLMCPVLVV